MNKTGFLVGAALSIILISGCSSVGTWEKHEKAQIATYVKSLGDTVYSLKPSGLYYIELSAGSGRMPVEKDTVIFRYNGMFLNRTIFDSNYSITSPYAAVIGNYEIIPGLDEGLRYMKEGGRGRFLLPSNLAYGASGIWGYIPGYSPLLFEVDLVTVIPGPPAVK